MVVSLFVVGISAQEPQKRQRMTAEERASKQTEMMTKNLALTSEQEVKIKEINLRYAKQAEEKMASAQNDRESNREAIKNQMKAKDDELKQVLTGDQYNKWKSERKEFTKKGKERMNKEKNDSK